jgi:hypothetical protein
MIRYTSTVKIHLKDGSLHEETFEGFSPDEMRSKGVVNAKEAMTRGIAVNTPEGVAVVRGEDIKMIVVTTPKEIAHAD